MRLMPPRQLKPRRSLSETVWETAEVCPVTLKRCSTYGGFQNLVSPSFVVLTCNRSPSKLGGYIRAPDSWNLPFSDVRSSGEPIVEFFSFVSTSAYRVTSVRGRGAKATQLGLLGTIRGIGPY